MRKSIWVIGLGLWLSGALWIVCGDFPNTIQAAKTSGEIQKEIERNHKKQQSAQEEKKQLEKEIAAMETEKKDMLSYLKQLDDKQRELSEKIQSNQDKIRSSEKKVKKLRQKRKKAEAQKEKQYDTMMRRIKYMYENGSDGYLELLLDSQSLSELFNRTEYVSRVSDYDRGLLDNYKELEGTIRLAESDIRKYLTNLKEMRERLEVEKSSMDLLAEKKQKEMEEYQALMAKKKDTLDETKSLLAKQEEELERLMAAQRAAVEREQRERNRESSSDNGKPVPAGGFGWPLPVSGRITSYFGYRSSPTAGASSYHKGIDIAVPAGTNVLASKSGTVVTASYSSAAGNYVAISHGNGIYTYYMHCSGLKVKVGQQVARGQKIALSGNTGISTGPHLHFAVFAGGSYVNPLQYVSQ